MMWVDVGKCWLGIQAKARDQPAGARPTVPPGFAPQPGPQKPPSVSNAIGSFPFPGQPPLQHPGVAGPSAQPFPTPWQQPVSQSRATPGSASHEGAAQIPLTLQPTPPRVPSPLFPMEQFPRQDTPPPSAFFLPQEVPQQQRQQQHLAPHGVPDQPVPYGFPDQSVPYRAPLGISSWVPPRPSGMLPMPSSQAAGPAPLAAGPPAPSADIDVVKAWKGPLTEEELHEVVRKLHCPLSHVCPPPALLQSCV